MVINFYFFRNATLTSAQKMNVACDQVYITKYIRKNSKSNVENMVEMRVRRRGRVTH